LSSRVRFMQVIGVTDIIGGEFRVPVNRVIVPLDIHGKAKARRFCLGLGRVFVLVGHLARSIILMRPAFNISV